VLFAVSQNLGLIVFDRWVTIPGLLTLNFPMILGTGWAIFDYFALAIAFAIVPHFLILLLTVRKLFSVVAANMRQT
jgi:hypothetical protein